jgi:DNA topoisomerase-1
MTEVEGKATGWCAFYHGGKWMEELATKPKSKAKPKVKPKAK